MVDDLETQSSPSRVRLSVGGMTCAACVGTISRAISEIDGISDISIDLLGSSASVVISKPSLVDILCERIDELGYDCQVVSVDAISPEKPSRKSIPKHQLGGGKVDTSSVTDVGCSPREVSIAVHGMYCRQCPIVISTALARFPQITILKPITVHTDPIFRIRYTPSAPEFTIRTILSAISDASPHFSVSIAHPPSSEDLAQKIYKRQQRQILLRLLVAILIAIPTFVIGIVYMSLVGKENPGRIFFETNIWAGQVARGEWALFLLATPVMFYSAFDYHHRSIKEMLVLWKPGRRTSWSSRFLRFGSMNLLVSLGVSIAYFSSIALLALAATRSQDLPADQSMFYFDSVVFLTMFLLIGRYMEAFSKHQASSAVSLLSRLRGSQASLLVPRELALSSIHSQDQIESEKAVLNQGGGFRSMEGESKLPDGLIIQTVSVDLLDVGDVVRVYTGSTPPADGTIVSSSSLSNSDKVVTNFDESSLTGESREVKKYEGDQVFVGTINKGRAVDVRVDAVGGETMLEKVIEVVRQGQTRRAPIERLADTITSYFVPFVTFLAICTWVIWLGVGLGGVLPGSTVKDSVGGWPVWTLEFAISVFVIACPCGIGLAAPTALLVGSGLAARYGILARGGGEAFQEASQIDVMVFDKTGTLTEGGEPKVTEAVICVSGGEGDLKREDVLGVGMFLASASSHPLCSALRKYCEEEGAQLIEGRDVDETAGRGMKGICSGLGRETELEAIMGNEKWLEENGGELDQGQMNQLEGWKNGANSVVVLAIRSTGRFRVVAMFAIADKIREEAPSVVTRLQNSGIQVWMISGDNVITAKAVARAVGIPQDHVIAGVLPHEKADKILWLQQTASQRRGKRKSQKTNKRSIVAMVGDGINDAPALATSDVGIAIGSGSDVAISSAKFILVSSNLNSILTLTDLSQKVFNRIKFNFMWAMVYNIVAVPIAAGVLYPAGHVRLSPVWSSLAMAWSSTSVVCSSLLLKLYKEPKSLSAA